jgi:Cu/Ag efflux protein CusF
MLASINRSLGTAAAAVLFFTALTSSGLAQKPVSVSDVVTASFTIDAIDHGARIVTLKAADGTFQDLFCGPEVQRFDALKVGDTVTFRYHESVVTALHHASAATRPPAAAAVTRTPGNRPGGTLAQQMTAVVTIAAIDAKTPAVTITTENGHRMSFRVENAKNLEGYKVGDKVEVTYTQALAVNVTPAK